VRIAVIGAGAVGMHYARKWREAGHTVTLAYTRNRDGLAARASEIGAETASPRDAVSDADVVLFSVPFEHIRDAAQQIGPLHDQVVIDSTNPFTPDRSSVVELAPGQTAFSIVAHALPGARLVKALHNLGVVQVEDPHQQPVIFVVSTDAEARSVVSGLVTEAGLVAVESDDSSAVAATEAPGRLFTAPLDATQARAALTTT